MGHHRELQGRWAKDPRRIAFVGGFALAVLLTTLCATTAGLMSWRPLAERLAKLQERAGVDGDGRVGDADLTRLPCGDGSPPGLAAPGAGASMARALAGVGSPIPLLDLPFPYDGSAAGFGGTAAQFQTAVQRVDARGGRINSYMDHLWPLYPAPQQHMVTAGREPLWHPTGSSVLTFFGVASDYELYSGHPGYDFFPDPPYEPTTPVLAAADGVVVDAGQHAASGALFVKIQHRVPAVGDFLSIYWHLRDDAFFDAAVAMRRRPVKAGTRIGTMGNTGWSTGYHLHFEARFDRNGDGAFELDEVVDPFGFVPSTAYPVDPWAVASEFADARGERYVHAPSVSRYLWKHPLWASVDVGADSGGGLGLWLDGARGGGPCFARGALPAGAVVHFGRAPDVPQGADLAGIGAGCVLSAFDATGAPIARFDPPARIELAFDARRLEDVDRRSLTVLWQSDGGAWEPLASTVDASAGRAVALVDRPGRCMLAGRPLRDIVPPRTLIEASGPKSPDGRWYDTVVVSLSAGDGGEDGAEGVPVSGVDHILYSLDGGDSWQRYTTPFALVANGIPSAPAEDSGEAFVGGPGRYLVLARAVDRAGNDEVPPAERRIVIDPRWSEPVAELPPAVASAAPAGATPALLAVAAPPATALVPSTAAPAPGVLASPTAIPTALALAPALPTQGYVVVTMPPVVVRRPTPAATATARVLVVTATPRGVPTLPVSIAGGPGVVAGGPRAPTMASAALATATPAPNMATRAAALRTATTGATAAATALPTVDAAPLAAPVRLHPDGSIKDEYACGKPMAFEWQALEPSAAVAGYEWQLRIPLRPGDLLMAMSRRVAEPELEIVIDCSLVGPQTWRVRGVDNAGQAGPWSANAIFVVLPGSPAPGASATASATATRGATGTATASASPEATRTATARPGSTAAATQVVSPTLTAMASAEATAAPSGTPLAVPTVMATATGSAIRRPEVPIEPDMPEWEIRAAGPGRAARGSRAPAQREGDAVRLEARVESRALGGARVVGSTVGGRIGLRQRRWRPMRSSWASWLLMW